MKISLTDNTVLDLSVEEKNNLKTLASTAGDLITDDADVNIINLAKYTLENIYNQLLESAINTRNKLFSTIDNLFSQYDSKIDNNQTTLQEIVNELTVLLEFMPAMLGMSKRDIDSIIDKIKTVEALLVSKPTKETKATVFTELHSIYISLYKSQKNPKIKLLFTLSHTESLKHILQQIDEHGLFVWIRLITEILDVVEGTDTQSIIDEIASLKNNTNTENYIDQCWKLKIILTNFYESLKDKKSFEQVPFFEPAQTADYKYGMQWLKGKDLIAYISEICKQNPNKGIKLFEKLCIDLWISNEYDKFIINRQNDRDQLDKNSIYHKAVHIEKIDHELELISSMYRAESRELN